MNVPLTRVDHSALRTNQAVIVTLNLSAFIFDLPWLAGVVGLMMLLGTLRGVPAFGFIYRLGLKPLRWLAPDVLADNPQPHRFAQGFGSVVLLLGTVFLALAQSLLGWVLVWLVIALAALNLFGGFCVGCAMYYWLNRLNFPGFSQSPPAGTIPGKRPKWNS
jgi:hypothetical protein